MLPLLTNQAQSARELFCGGLQNSCVVHCPQGLVVATRAANFALSEVQADFLHRKGYNLTFIFCVVIKAIGYLLPAVSVVSSFFYEWLNQGVQLVSARAGICRARRNFSFVLTVTVRPILCAKAPHKSGSVCQTTQVSTGADAQRAPEYIVLFVCVDSKVQLTLYVNVSHKSSSACPGLGDQHRGAPE